MSNPVMVILRWRDEPEAALERYERTVAAWREGIGEPALDQQVIAGHSERGELVVVNVFASEADHHAFHAVGDLLAEQGHARPEVERVEVLRGWPGDRDQVA